MCSKYNIILNLKIYEEFKVYFKYAEKGKMKMVVELDKESICINQEADRKKADRMDAERRSEKLTEKTAEKKADHEAAQRSDLDEDTIMISAGSIEELMQKIQDVQMAARSDTVQTEEEKKLGRHIDFAL